MTERDILAPSMAMLQTFDYYSHTKNARPLFAKLIATQPRLLACMHGASWRGDGAVELMFVIADAPPQVNRQV